ncbi:MAG: hypothetical protein QM757_22860 [Paludibaculum sp.]
MKHGFVRQDVHVINFFCLAFLALGLLLLFLDSWRFNRNLPILLMLMVLVSIQSVQWRLGWTYLDDVTGWSNARAIAGVIQLSRTRQQLAHEPLPAYGRDFPLEPPILQAIGRHSVTIVSPVLIQAAWYNLNFVPLPVPQGYQCTSKLDHLNADWLTQQGPDKVLLDWFSVDSHHPLAGNPATMHALFQSYEPEVVQPRHLLLRRRATRRAAHLQPLQTQSVDITQRVAIPQAGQPVFARLELELTTFGKLAKLLYHVPEIRMTLSPAPDGESTYRVMADSLGTLLPVSHLPANLPAAANYFDGRPSANPKFSRLTFSGPGLDYYHHTVRVEFLTLNPDLD